MNRSYPGVTIICGPTFLINMVNLSKDTTFKVVISLYLFHMISNVSVLTLFDYGVNQN